MEGLNVKRKIQRNFELNFKFCDHIPANTQFHTRIVGFNPIEGLEAKQETMKHQFELKYK